VLLQLLTGETAAPYFAPWRLSTAATADVPRAEHRLPVLPRHAAPFAELLSAGDRPDRCRAGGFPVC
jgi:hypothetical protein